MKLETLTNPIKKSDSFITALEFNAEDILFVLSEETLLENYTSMYNLFHNTKYKTMAIPYTFLQKIVDIFKRTPD